MEILYNVLELINNVFLGIISVAFGIQIFYMLLFFLPAKKYKQAEVQHKFAIIIPARNEEVIIGQMLQNLNNLNYPKELYDIFVFAHNCTDHTATIAAEYGAIVFEVGDDDPKHRISAYALKFGFEELLKSYDNYDAFIRVDADSILDPNYIDKMNDAFASGVKLAKGYNNSKNIGQNHIATISGFWYLRDNRFGCQPRSRLGVTQMMVGSGMMISADIIRENGGWIDLEISDDAAFTMSQLLKGKKSRYVKDAIIYDDQPTTLKDTFSRNIRMGKGLIRTFFSRAVPCLGKFFITLRYSYLDMFLMQLFIPVALIFCTWMPLYYGFAIVYNIVTGNFILLYSILTVMGYALAFAFVLAFILQAFFVYLLERKRIKAPFRRVLPGILLFPLFMIYYSLGIVLGIFSKGKWRAVKRNVVREEGMDEVSEDFPMNEVLEDEKLEENKEPI